MDSVFCVCAWKDVSPWCTKIISTPIMTIIIRSVIIMKMMTLHIEFSPTATTTDIGLNKMLNCKKFATKICVSKMRNSHNLGYRSNRTISTDGLSLSIL